MKIEQIKKILEKLFLVIAEHAFLASLLLFFLALIFGGFLFYKYDILAQKAGPEIFKEPFLFKEKTYQEVLRVWRENEKKFEEADSKKYPNPFEKPIPTEEETPGEEEEG